MTDFTETPMPGRHTPNIHFEILEKIGEVDKKVALIALNQENQEKNTTAELKRIHENNTAEFKRIHKRIDNENLKHCKKEPSFWSSPKIIGAVTTLIIAISAFISAGVQFLVSK